MRAEYYTKILDLVSRYMAKISDTIKSMDPEIWNTLQADIADIKGTLPKINEKIETAAQCMDQYTLYDSIDSKLHGITSIVTNAKYFDKYVYKFSQTFVAEVTTLRNAVIDALATYVQESQKYDAELFPKIKVDNNVKLNYESPNRFTVYALSKWVPTLAPDQQLPILQKLEKTKDALLGTPPRVLSDNTSLVYRYNLRPASDIMTIEEIRKLIGEKTPVIMLPLYAGTPMVFDILPLVSSEYVIKHDLNLPELHGLNKKILQRFTTMQLLGKSTDKLTIDDGAQYIVSSLGSEKYRLLSDTITIKPTQRTLQAMIYSLRNGQSRRPEAYNIPQQYKNTNLKSLATEYVSQKFTMDSAAITTPFVDDAMDMIHAELKTTEELDKLIDSLPSKLNSLLLKSIQRVVKPIESSELYLTMLVKYESLSRNFRKTFQKSLHITTRENAPYEIRAAIESTVKEIAKSGAWSDLETSFKEFVINKTYVDI